MMVNGTTSDPASSFTHQTIIYRLKRGRERVCKPKPLLPKAMLSDKPQCCSQMVEKSGGGGVRLGHQSLTLDASAFSSKLHMG